MTLIKSISGMRGTIGGAAGENLTPIDIVEFTAAYSSLLLAHDTPADSTKHKVVVGRDGRLSGKMVSELVINTLLMMGIDVIDLDYSTTPTVEMAVVHHHAVGGIIITASHNPKEWNALKFLNAQGEFIDASVGQAILEKVADKDFVAATVDQLGAVYPDENAIIRHIEAILALPTVKPDTIRHKKYRVVVDAINSTGAIAMPPLLEALHCEVIVINGDHYGRFSHNPEPLAENLQDLCQTVVAQHADLGIALDPDVDRLAFVDEKGNYCGEEYTLVMVAQWILENTPGHTVSNLSSTIVLRQITEQLGYQYHAAPVGEVNVVNKMKTHDAVIGGEGNGGIIYPALHYGRDAMVGVALLLSALSEHNVSLSEYRATFEDYHITKDKIQLTKELDVDALLNHVEQHFESHEIDTQDGVKIYFEAGWVHLRKSNTEPIIRLYAEGRSQEAAQALSTKVADVIETSKTNA